MTTYNLLKAPKLSHALQWTNANKEAFLKYLDTMKSMMALKDWEILVDWTPTGEEAYATIAPIFGQKRAVLQLSKEFLSESLEHQRHTLCHELIHCHVFPLTEIVRTTNEVVMTGVAQEIAWMGINQTMETCTDGIADGFALLLPLPAWPAKPTRAKAASKAV